MKWMEIHTVLTNNRIWKIRLADVAIITKKIIEGYALTGVIIRGSNIKKDLRLLGYEMYSIINLGIS
jgi:NADH-quinone oxidoreductase subunit D